VPLPEWWFELKKTVLGFLRLYESAEWRAQVAYSFIQDAVSLPLAEDPA
jgi:hypothetical protein